MYVPLYSAMDTNYFSTIICTYLCRFRTKLGDVSHTSTMKHHPMYFVSPHFRKRSRHIRIAGRVTLPAMRTCVRFPTHLSKGFKVWAQHQRTNKILAHNYPKELSSFSSEYHAPNCRVQCTFNLEQRCVGEDTSWACFWRICSNTSAMARSYSTRSGGDMAMSAPSLLSFSFPFCFGISHQATLRRVDSEGITLLILCPSPAPNMSCVHVTKW